MVSPIRHIMMFIDLFMVASNKQQFSGQEFKEIHRNIRSLKTPKQAQIPPRLRELLS